MNIQQKTAYVVVQDKIKVLSVTQLIEKNFTTLSKHEESPVFLTYLFSSFTNNDYSINLITWKDFEYITVRKDDIIVIPPWYVTGNKYLLKNKEFNQELVSLISEIPQKSCHIITLTRSHSCWNDFSDLYYTGNTVGFIRSPIHNINIKQNHTVLNDGLAEIINRSQFGDDFFDRMPGDGTKFNTLISKTPQSFPALEFNLFGFMKFKSGSYLFNIDIGNAGSIYSHQKLFSKMLDNVIRFILKK